ncbi:3'-5' exoribonuclease [Sphingopyxis indica]|uniref:3'-5' exoribonuclease domain-containing protein n=1 Tax=Sphingopyxis indica TaxID=436663 RepID=UPI002938CF76|nr:3'-5' exoribonuclease [Sphingopyxis indica]WOF44269.1 3'-5' exoribonuclease [Sphingopyxis indica]
MTDIMVDLETTGTKPAHSGILQLAAIKFNLEEQAVGEVFDRCPALLPNRFWDEGTREFWGQHSSTYSSIIARQEDAEQVFVDFSKWVTKDAPQNGYRFWSKPLSFDWPMLASHFEQLGRPMPFHYRQARDLNTYIAACRDRGAEHIDMSFIQAGVAHNALSDCAQQLKMFFSAKNGVFHEVLAE